MSSFYPHSDDNYEDHPDLGPDQWDDYDLTPYDYEDTASYYDHLEWDDYLSLADALYEEDNS